METSGGACGARHRGIVLVITACLVAVNSPVTGQEQPEPSPRPVTITTSDAQVAVDHLRVVLRPLTKDELEVELGGWLELLRAKIREVGDTELKLQSLAELTGAESFRLWLNIHPV